MQVATTWTGKTWWGKRLSITRPISVDALSGLKLGSRHMKIIIGTWKNGARVSSSRVWIFLCPYYCFGYDFSFLFKLIVSPSQSLEVCPLKSVATILQLTTRDLKIRGRRRLRNCRWKSEFMFFQSSSRLLQVTDFFKCRRTILKLNS